MCPPTYFDVRERKNPHMGQPIERVRAQQEWENLRATLLVCGLSVSIIDPVQGLDDMVFTANQVFVGQHSDLGKFVVPSRMRHASRQKEVVHFVNWFRENGYKVIEIDLAGEYLEGHGDLIWHPGRSVVWAGYGFRSSAGGVEKFSETMRPLGFRVEPLELVDDYCYHLDTCFTPLSAEAVLIYAGAFAKKSLMRIKQEFVRVHELTREDALQFVLNGIVANGCYITPRVTPTLQAALIGEGLRATVVETSEFEKSGGSVFCMKTFLE